MLMSGLFAQSPIIKVEGQDLLKSLAYTENSPYVKLYEWGMGDGTVPLVEWDPNGNNWTPKGFERKGKVYLRNQGKITHTIVGDEAKPGYWNLKMLGNKDKIIKVALSPNSVTMENPSIYIDKAFIKEQVVCEENDGFKNVVYSIKFPQKLSFWMEEKKTISTHGNKNEYVVSFGMKPACATKADTHKTNISSKILDSTKMQLKLFLKSFYKAGEGSFPAKALRYYDSKVDRYFSMRNVSKEDILEDKIRYYKKWVTRQYDMKDFEIIDSHVADSVQYYVVNTVVEWNVTSAKGKSQEGISYNIITLVENDNGFLVKSIKSVGSSTPKASANASTKNSVYIPEEELESLNCPFDNQVIWNGECIDYKKYVNLKAALENSYKVINVAHNDTLNVRSNPYFTNHNKVAELLPDALNIKLIKCMHNSKGTKWCKIKHNDYGYSISGWVIARCLSRQEKTNILNSVTYKVIKIPSNDTLSVRANAGTRNRKIGDLAYYTTGIKRIKCKNAHNGRKWCKVSHPSIVDGWVRSKYLRKE
jgi:hypothetical protein